MKRADRPTACPRLPPWRPTWYASVAKRLGRVDRASAPSAPGHVEVAKVKIVREEDDHASTGLMSGSVTCQKRPHEPAPSTSRSRGFIVFAGHRPSGQPAQ